MTMTAGGLILHAPTARAATTSESARVSTARAVTAKAARTTAKSARRAKVARQEVKAHRAVAVAKGQIGDPYRYGATGPGAFDCSGLVQYSYAAAGVALPHSSRMQSTMGTPVDRSALLPGDLVFFYSPVSHVGIYIGNGQMVHASTSGSPVKTAMVDDMGSYNRARRIVG
jgi:cell wall-associated NlpC family hydrolase